jgi:polyisoprenoid-binding protein YceI
MYRFALVIASIAVLGLPLSGVAGTWTLDPAHSSAHFAVRHMMVSTVRGNFSKVSGTVESDEQDVLKSVAQATIDAASIDTGVAARDNHLRSADFFDVAQYPTITFRSKGIAKAADGRLKVTGDLTMRGVTKEVVLDVEPLSPVLKDQNGTLRTGTSATTRISRKDFGLTWNRALEGGGVVVSDDVNITIDLELTQKPAGK